MKLSILFFGLLLSFTSLAQAQTSYALEQKILDCFYRQHEANNIDVRKTIENLETVFVNHKILADRSGKSYISLIESIKTGNLPNIGDPGLLSDIDALGYIPATVFCKDTNTIKFNAAEIDRSKLKYVLHIYDSLLVSGDVSNPIIAEELLKIFTAKDLEQEFYKSLELLVITNMITMNREVESDPSTMSGVVKMESRSNNSYSLLVKKDRIVAQGKAIGLDALKQSIKTFLMQTADQTQIDLPTIGQQRTSSGIIILQSELDTPYNLYARVKRELEDAYREIRNSYSVKFFKVSFDNLDKQKQEIIMQLVPERISEVK